MNSQPNPKPPSPRDANHHENAPDQPSVAPHKAIFGVIVVLIVFVALAVFGILSRRRTDDVLARTTTQLAAPTVIALPPQPGAPLDNFVLPGNVTAYTDAPINARTSGYLTRWYYDIGAHVKKGALLAEISSPEVDQQLAQAQADLATSQATANNARTQAERYSGLVGSNAVSRQDTETFVNQAASTASAVRSAQANVQRLQEMVSFEKVYAPFDGVVTARNVDTGQLINQGAGTELFHMQAIQTLRVYTNVPQLYADTARRGLKVDLTFPEFPGKAFLGTLVRTADAIDPDSRTLLVEIDVNNRDGKLFPGSLAQVHFKAPAALETFIVPSAALIFRRAGLQLGIVVNSSQGPVARLVPVIIGQDDGATVQIVNGLNAGDKVIQDPPDSLIDGEKVAPENPSSTTPAGGS